MSSALIIKENDDVAVAMQDIAMRSCMNINGRKLIVTENISKGHKISVRNIEKGSEVIKYGYPIGIASEPISKGEWVHDHNMVSAFDKTMKYDYKHNKKPEIHNSEDNRIFYGYKRNNGSIGIRNEIWIIPTVGCVNSVAKKLEDLAHKYISENIDGIYSFGHQFGCSQRGDDLSRTEKLLAGLAKNGNAAGILVLGLGCENITIEKMKKILGEYDSDRIKFMECHSEIDELEKGLEVIKIIIDNAKKCTREPLPLSELIIGIKCGASDIYSNITGNPMIGRFCDKLIDQGGSVILTEVPEMAGSEKVLMNRLFNINVYNRAIKMFKQFENYFSVNNENFHSELSDSNKQSGLTTIEEKSLGFIQKAGTSDIVDVIYYGQQIENKGLNLLYSPGNDLVASTSLAASGAHIILFTTGRGTPFGAPIPTVKISTNSTLYNKKESWIDFNAGEISCTADIIETAKIFYEYIIKLASGEIRAKNEINDYRDIALFKDGIIH